jgi:hypothetical protein
VSGQSYQLALPAHIDNPDLPSQNILPNVNLDEKTLTKLIGTIFHVSNNEMIDENNRNDISTTNLTKAEGFCYYIGLLVLMPYISKVIKNGHKNILQWILGLFLGVKNIEQSKMLNFNSLTVIIGETTKNLHHQRKLLKKTASKNTIIDLLKFNMELIDIKKCNDFYYDPHTKHYTGLKKILKGWCSKLRFAEKIINMDFIHTKDGYPAYIDNTDNYDDLRVRFFRNIANLRNISGIPEGQVLTYIVDRGIFAVDVLEQVADMPNTHLVTWEKNYNYQAWDHRLATGKGSIIKYRNNYHDFREIKYTHQEKIWYKSAKIRQIIVRIESNSQKEIIEVSILTDDLTRDANQIVQLMFNRWIQENDFKYLIAHFGIDQITTYESNKWDEIKENVQDRLYISGEYKALTAEIDNIRGRLKTSLLKKHRYDKKNKLSGKELSEKQQKICQKIESDITKSTKELEEKELQREQTEKMISKNKELAQQGYERLDTEIKLYMDIIKIIARNIYYLSFKTFKNMYNNFRDDHAIFRNIICSNGFIGHKDGVMQIQISPELELTPKVEAILTTIINEINQTEPVMPDGGNTKINLKIFENIANFFAIAS